MQTQDKILIYILACIAMVFVNVYLVGDLFVDYNAPTNSVEIPNPYNSQHIYDDWSFPQ